MPAYLRTLNHLIKSSCLVESAKYLQRGRLKSVRFSSLVEMDDADLLRPHASVSGMKVLDRKAFTRTVTVPCVELELARGKTEEVVGVLKKHFLKLRGIRPVQGSQDGKKKIYLDPRMVSKFDDFDQHVASKLNRLGVTEKNFGETPLNLTYENWSAEAVLKAILPKNAPPLTSYSNVGHIIHLNLKDHLLEYKHLIAQVLLDKVPTAKTVVNKTNAIDNVYRNFEMEILCGEENTLVSVVEYGVKFEFDFSKVYWNPRLSTEHDRIVNLLSHGDALFDLFAGVGPFSVRAALKKCLVYANDLNPDSFKWLKHNIEINKKSQGYIRAYNKDAADFILSDVKEHLVGLWRDEYFSGKIHIVMNLPATGLTYLKYFKNLISKREASDLEMSRIEEALPVVHCHFFVKEPDTPADVFERDSAIKYDKGVHEFHYVRNVSRGKEMHRVTFKLPSEYLLNENDNWGDEDEPPVKRICPMRAQSE